MGGMWGTEVPADKVLVVDMWGKEWAASVEVVRGRRGSPLHPGQFATALCDTPVARENPDAARLS